MRLLLLAIIAIPILEIWVLIKVGGLIGGFNTIGLILLTAIAGLALLRQQGLQTLLRARQKVERGEAPAGEMVEGIFLAVGGIFLMLPGFISDVVGFCCLIPGLRRGLIGWGLRRMTIASHDTRSGSFRDESHPGSHTIEGDYRREDDRRKEDPQK